MYAVTVAFSVAPDQWAAFLPLLRDNARASVEGEPACHRFDVATDPDRPHQAFLYELYTDRAGFDAHLASAHFRAFDAAVAPMILAKDVRTYREVQT